MALAITIGARTATSIVLGTAGRTAGYDQVQVQYGARPDFLFYPSPTVNLVPDGSGNVTLADLNQDNTYFIRARERIAATGVVTAWVAVQAAYTPVSVARDTTPAAVMVRPAIVVVPETVVWAGLNVDAGHPVDNLMTDAPAEQLWQTGNRIDFTTTGVPIDTVALLATNFPAGMTWRVRSYPTAADRTANTNVAYDSLGQPVLASANLPGRPSYHALMSLPALRSEQYWRITPGGTSPPGGLYVATYGVVGRARTAKNIAADKVEAALDYGGIERLRDGVPDRRVGFRGRRVEFDIAVMTEAQWETQFADLRMDVGLTDPVLVVPNTRAGVFLHDRILYGPIAQNRAQQPFTPRFTQSFAIESLI